MVLKREPPTLCFLIDVALDAHLELRVLGVAVVLKYEPPTMCFLINMMSNACLELSV